MAERIEHFLLVFAHEAVAEVEVAMDAWLEAARSDGRPVPEPSSRIAEA